MGHEPNQLEISIGGYMGSSYSLELKDSGLQYEHSGDHYSNPQIEVVPVTDEQWRAFRATLDSIGVWQWKSSYPNPGICDGTQWSASIAFQDAKVECRGDNSYPEGEGGADENNDPFEAFLGAVQTLIGGREFR